LNTLPRWVPVAAGVGAIVVGAAVVMWVFGKPRKAKLAAAVPDADVVVSQIPETSLDDSKEEATEETKDEGTKRRRKTRSKGKKRIVAGPNPDMLQSMLIESFQSLSGGGSFSGEQEVKLLSIVRTLEPNAYPASLRFLVTQWMLAYQTMGVYSIETKEQALEFLAQSPKDIALCWRMMDFDPKMLTNAEDQAFYGVLKMDLATRLRDVQKISSLYESAMKTVRTTQNKAELALCFSTAPVLGKWKDFDSLGVKLERMSDGGLREFHEAALQRPDIPDYEILYSFVKDNDFSPVLLEEKVDPAWKAFAIGSCEVKFSNIECADPAQADSISQEIAHLKDWQKLPVSEHAKIIQNGCFYQCVGISAVPIPMVGPVSSRDRLLLKGYIDMEQSPIGPVRQTEFYDLRLENTDGSLVYTGRYIVSQDKLSGSKVQPGKSSSRMEYAMKMHLVETPL